MNTLRAQFFRKNMMIFLFGAFFSNNLFAGIADMEQKWESKFIADVKYQKALKKHMQAQDYAICHPMTLLLIASEEKGEKFPDSVVMSMGFLRGALVYYRTTQMQQGKTVEYFTKLSDPYMKEIGKDPNKAVSKYIGRCNSLSEKIFGEVS
jgi:hypothetical protein